MFHVTGDLPINFGNGNIDVPYKDFEEEKSGIKYYHGNVIIKVDGGWIASSITSSVSNFDSNYYQDKLHYHITSPQSHEAILHHQQ